MGAGSLGGGNPTLYENVPHNSDFKIKHIKKEKDTFHQLTHSSNAWNSKPGLDQAKIIRTLRSQCRPLMWVSGTQICEPSMASSQSTCSLAGSWIGARTWTRHSNNCVKCHSLFLQKGHCDLHRPTVFFKYQYWWHSPPFFLYPYSLNLSFWQNNIDLGIAFLFVQERNSCFWFSWFAKFSVP